MTTTTLNKEFSDFCAQRDAQNTIQLNVVKYTLQLCDALRQNFIEYSIKSHYRSLSNGDNTDYHENCIAKLKNGECAYSYVIESGRKYHKIIMVIDNGPGRHVSRSVHCFVDKNTGEMYKSASWKSPAKGVRYDLRLIKDREWLLSNADWASNYLYAR
jgi:hypothetical protein